MGRQSSRGPSPHHQSAQPPNKTSHYLLWDESKIKCKLATKLWKSWHESKDTSSRHFGFFFLPKQHSNQTSKKLHWFCPKYAHKSTLHPHIVNEHSIPSHSALLPRATCQICNSAAEIGSHSATWALVRPNSEVRWCKLAHCWWWCSGAAWGWGR